MATKGTLGLSEPTTGKRHLLGQQDQPAACMGIMVLILHSLYFFYSLPMIAIPAEKEHVWCLALRISG